MAKSLNMYSRLTLISGRQKDVVVERISDHLDPTHWPSVLSSPVEELLLRQMLQTVQEVIGLIREQGASVDQIPTEAEARWDFLRDGKDSHRSSATSGREPTGSFRCPL